MDTCGPSSTTTCRLAAQGDSGRVRWCVGSERSWRAGIRRLTLLPVALLLLVLVLVAVLVAQRAHSESVAVGARAASLDEDGGSKSARHEMQQGIRTSYVPQPADDDVIASAARSRRDADNFWEVRHSASEVRRRQAHHMLQLMDASADPCDDFYQFACGNWHLANPIPADKSSFDTFEMLRESLDAVLRDLLLEDVPPAPALAGDGGEAQTEDAVVKAKHLFAGCMDVGLIRRRGVRPLLRLLAELGGWPVLEARWDGARFDLEWLLGQLRLYNNDIIVAEWVGPDIRNSAEYVIQIDQSSLGLPSRDYFVDAANRRFVDAYAAFIARVAQLLGADAGVAYADAARIVAFEADLSAITVAGERRKNVSDIYVRLTMRELHALVPQIDWFKYIGIVTQRAAGPDDAIVTFSLGYLRQLVGLLSATPPRTLANYALWRFVRHRVNNLDERFQDAKQRFYRLLFGREQRPARWQSCVAQVNSNLGMALGAAFVARHFDERSKNDTLAMTGALRRAFKHLLLATEWLDAETRRAAALKVDCMRLRIGYPNYILNPSALNARYADVQVHPALYFESTLSILQHLTRLEHAKLAADGGAVDKGAWNSPPAVVNAYYSRNRNQIMFPAGILQPPFYHRHLPRCLNYGGIGVVIGHEMTHGFDDKGRLFDKDGNLNVWWRRAAVDEFHARARCLVDQYGAFVVPEAGAPVDGVATQGENIADNGGITQAYRAYGDWLRDHPERVAGERLPGVNLTHLQLFFLNFAQIWCGTTRPEAARNKLRTAVHAPGRFRVIGTLSNSDDFAAVYGCPAGAPMNPANKCRIW